MSPRLLVAVLLLGAACAPGAAAAKPNTRKTPMDDCTKVISPAEADQLAAAIEALPEGGVLCLKPGTYKVNAVLQRSMTLRGLGATPGEVILDGDGRTSVLAVS